MNEEFILPELIFLAVIFTELTGTVFWILDSNFGTNDFVAGLMELSNLFKSGLL